MSEYPMLDKINECHEKSQVIGEFIEFLTQDKRLSICSYIQGNYIPITSIDKMLAEFFGIDTNQAENERRRLLESLRSRQNDGTVKPTNKELPRNIQDFKKMIRESKRGAKNV